jgi:hypothetical protein
MKQLLINLILSIVSLALFLTLGEIITRLTLGSPLIMQPDSVLFWKYDNDQVGHQKFYSPVARVDKNGFRYSGKEFDAHLPSIYIGGDSYAWGEGVSDLETFSAQLQKLLDSHNMKYNILNGGVPGYGIGQIIDRMEIECKKYNPKYAIFLWVEYDINRLRNLSPEKKKKFLRDYRLRALFRYSAFLKYIKERIFDKLLHKDLGFGYHGDENIEYGKKYNFSEKVAGLTPIIKQNVYFLKNKNIIPIWVFMTVPSIEFKDYLNTLSVDLSVFLIDPESEYRKQFPELKNMETKHSGHFRPEVCGLLANEVFKKVFQK